MWVLAGFVHSAPQGRHIKSIETNTYISHRNVWHIGKPRSELSHTTERVLKRGKVTGEGFYDLYGWESHMSKVKPYFTRNQNIDLLKNTYHTV